MYSQAQLLDRFYTEYEAKQLSIKNATKQAVLVKPLTEKLNKHTFITNIGDVCESFNRPQNEIIHFVESELQVTTSISMNGALIIAGIYQQPVIEKLFATYAKTYVLCKICKSPKTLIVKENRNTTMQCLKCGAQTAIG